MTGYENPTIAFTALKCSADFLKFIAAFAVKSGNLVTPAMVVDAVEDFQNIALVVKCVGGGMAAIALSDAISTGGISLTTSKGGKGTYSITITGYGTIENPGKIPVDYYAIPAIDVQIDCTGSTLAIGDTLALHAAAIPNDAAVTWTCDDNDKAAVSSAGVVTPSDTGTVTITASITVDGKTKTDTCIVHIVSA